jgi:phage anti-repressor protein
LGIEKNVNMAEKNEKSASAAQARIFLVDMSSAKKQITHLAM